MLRVIRQLWVFSRFISEIQSSPAAPGYRQSRHKRKNSGTCWLTPAYKNARKEKAGVRDRRRSQKLNSALKRAISTKWNILSKERPRSHTCQPINDRPCPFERVARLVEIRVL